MQVKCPTLIIWGNNDGALDTQLAKLSAQTVSGKVTVKIIQNCSHWAQMDQPEAVNTYIRTFIETVE